MFPFLFLANVAMAGVGYLLFKPNKKKAPKTPFVEFKLSEVKIGSPIPVVFGFCKVGGLIMEWGDWTVVRHKQSMKGGKMF